MATITIALITILTSMGASLKTTFLKIASSIGT